jgi:hypothetical protein
MLLRVATIVFSVTIFAACSAYSDRILVGTWRMMGKRGATMSVTFRPDHTLSMSWRMPVAPYVGGSTGTWRLAAHQLFIQSKTVNKQRVDFVPHRADIVQLTSDTLVLRAHGASCESNPQDASTWPETYHRIQ